MRPECDEIRPLTAELALGVASGEERARVLEHASECRECRQELEQLTGVVDDLLLLAPEAEPSAGFEDRVLRAIAPPKRKRWALGRRLMQPALAATAAAALAAGLVAVHYRGDHKLASQYRQALAAADGTRFEAVPLRDPAGVKRGSVSLYKGKPSWVLVAIPAGAAQPVRAEIVSRSGAHVPLTGFKLRNGVWGGPLPMAFNQIASVQLLDAQGHSALVAFMRAHW
jgi:hypothetical protein